MIRRLLITSGLATALVLGAAGTAHASQTQDFVETGTSDFGLAYYYADTYVERDAAAAGYTPDQCTIVWTSGDYYSYETIDLRCTR